MKRLAIVGGIIVALILLVILLLPLFVNVDSFRPEVEQKFSAALGRKVTIGKLSASIFSGAEADNISISDDPAFSRAAFLQASKLQIGVEWWPLIFSRQLNISSLTIKSPEVVLLKNSAGRWNFSSLGSGAASAGSAKQPAASPGFSVARLQITNGRIK